jgi:hypothetical protein
VKLYARPVELCVFVIDEDDPSSSGQVVAMMKRKSMSDREGSGMLVTT